jgi:hypothetical protein
MVTSEIDWQPQPAAAQWMLDRIQFFRANNPAVPKFEQLLLQQTGSRLQDWIDHLCLIDPAGLTEAGFVEFADGWFEHPGALLPAVHVTSFDRMLLRVDSVSDFTLANGYRFHIVVEGEPLDLRRIAVIDNQVRPRLGVIERHGCTASCPPQDLTANQRMQLLHTEQTLRLRPRQFGTDQDAFAFTRRLVETAVEEVGQDVACDLFFQGERDYWGIRNLAGRLQQSRQNTLGLGWGNHDHHTYRSSRACFSRLIGIFELLGFECRERFYAGREAGWGAQVLEHRRCGIVIFADVDLSPDEVEGDFAHEPLPEQANVGTIGLWCALHGEALFDAGMHHLESRYNFDAARSQLQAIGVNSMDPFTNFPYLKQCFTVGERWPVAAGRIRRALERGWITAEQAERFESEGAVGSHLEILQRDDGYRGFNQTGINDIIRKTDPRTLAKNS